LENRDLLRRYLLGSLSEREQKEMERECTTNDALSEALQTAENDLTDAYVCQELSPEQRLQFESHFLDSSERRTRVEIARMLMSSEIRERVPVGPMVEEKRQPIRWSWLFSLATGFAAATAAVALIFFMVQNQRLRNELVLSRSAQMELQNRLATLQQQEAQGSLLAQSQAGHVHLPTAPIVSLMLSTGLLRSGGNHQSSVLTLPPGDSEAVLMLRLEPTSLGTSSETESPRYDVVLQTVEGRKLQTLRALGRRQAPDGGKMVSARFRSQRLAEGDYLVTLLLRTAGGERKELASYSFSVIR
jgi:hypothetical protein